MKVEMIKKVNIDEKSIASGIYGSVLESIEELISNYLTTEEEIDVEFAIDAIVDMKPNEMADIIEYILTEYKTHNGLKN